MRWLPVFCYLGVAVWQIGTHLDVLFPRDAATRGALQECFMEDNKFDPLNQTARIKCFEARLQASTQQMPPPRQANFVDLRRAQGQGSMSGNDIRHQQMMR